MNGLYPTAGTPTANSNNTVTLLPVSAITPAGGISYAINRMELGADLLWDEGSFIVWDTDDNIGGEA